MTNRAATYGGKGFNRREGSFEADLGTLWRECRSSNEASTLKEVTLAFPGTEFEGLTEPDSSLLLDIPDLEKLQAQCMGLVQCFQDLGITVHLLTGSESYPNWIFQRDLYNATPKGVVLSRPASEQRKGEEVLQQRLLAELRVPIMAMPVGEALFEGADLLWVSSEVALISTNQRSNQSFLAQISGLFPNTRFIEIPLPPQSQHLLGIINFLAADHVAIWESRFPASHLSLLQSLRTPYHPFKARGRTPR